MEIKEVKMYVCPETGKQFKTKRGAEKSANEAREKARLAKIEEEARKISDEEKKKRSNYIRLNLESISDLPKMLTEKAKEFYNIEISDLSISLNFGWVSNSHEAPVNGVTNWSGRNSGLPTSYPGFSGSIKAKVICPKKGVGSASDILFRYGGFSCFYTSCGCPGSPIGEYAMDIGFYFFLDDFPILKKKYEIYEENYRKIMENKQRLEDNRIAAENFAENHHSVRSLDEDIRSLMEIRTRNYNDVLKQYLDGHKPELLEIDEYHSKIAADLNL